MMADIWINLGWSALALIICLVPIWMISLKMKDASIIDIFWGAGFGIVAVVCLYLAPIRTPYIWLLGLLPMIWAARLSVYLAKRNLGVLGGKGYEDPRYVAMRERSERKGMSEMAWRKRAFFSIFLGQGLLILIVSAPIWVAMGLGPFDPTYINNVQTGGFTGWQNDIGLIAILGGLLWLIGFLFEAIGDAQLAKFIKANKDYDGPYEEKPVLNTGLWKYTRHPNYFGNACMWWGIYLIACQTPWGWVTIFAPIIMTILLTRVSGRDLLERKLKTRPAYADYIQRTSGFFPLPPKSISP